MTNRASKNWILILVTVLLTQSLVKADDGPVSFSRDVRPILSGRCFKCHGFDPGTREAGLRLDTREGLFSEHNGEHPFVAKHPEQSAALRRVLSDDDDERMPPPSAKKDLTPREKEILRKWVEQGAPWEPHWAYIPPQRPDVPSPQGDDWSPHPIDRFIRQRQVEVGLTPSPEADRYTLIRRVSLDLTGLPPTPEEADAFIQDTDPAAYEKLVDRLLESPAYGERWARKWLDLARYADTNGYEKDRARTIWPYRDWVVQALNANMPFDQFTIRQIAGDLLPEATQADRIATGFHRNTMLNEEGGIDPLEYRYYAMADRVATTGITWLGLTTGCAQCHDHKYDPISHREYFGMMALLNNADEVELPLPEKAQHDDSVERAARAQELLKGLPDQWPVKTAEAAEAAPSPREAAEAAFQEWYAREKARAATWTTLQPVKLTSNLPLLTDEGDGVIFVTGDITKQDQYVINAQCGVKGVTAIRLEALPDVRLPGGGPGMTYYEGNKGDFFLTEIRLQQQGMNIPFKGASFSYGGNQFGPNSAGMPTAIDGDLQTGWSVDGRQGTSLTAIFTLPSPTDLDDISIELNFGRHFAASLGKFRLSVTTSPDPVALDLTPEATQLLAQEVLSEEEMSKLRQAFFLQAQELSKSAGEIRRLMAPSPMLTTLVFQERPAGNPRPTYLHHRGEYLQPKEQVPPVTLAFLNSVPEGTPLNRLTFAKWLVARDNPLTARVVVNRQWAALFGRGLVSTVQDFGFQGEPPTHPELLDWLAVEFMESGWNMKQLHRLIVTSRTYRQSSVVTPESRERDAANLWLSRGPRFRLEAEMIRDTALSASGLLSLRVGGPPVKPPQPEGISEATYGRPKWEASTGEDRYRRSLYTFLKRTAPFAMYSTFDAPSGEACLAQRDVSNTALQGLTLLNDLMFIEASRALAQKAVKLTGDDRAKAERLFRLVMTRPAEPAELDDLVSFVAQQRTEFADHQAEAETFSGSAGEDAPQLAAWVALARALLSLDEAVTRN
ncbi:PSD1 and planctomycete cytochrome C domain-containing protein [Planctomicrobium sp. SH661]|uniref:PSD1 and planctomycete cytochrome C domain-containing protein n=1 Tax=Planctomicrobium sp. SH661 TaxID=3448124 RepID=UPI003F5BB229